MKNGEYYDAIHYKNNSDVMIVSKYNNDVVMLYTIICMSSLSCYKHCYKHTYYAHNMIKRTIMVHVRHYNNNNYHFIIIIYLPLYILSLLYL